MRQFLICIDSDGCAIDSMEIKHRRAFGPCILEVWELEAQREQILKRWNEINLYTVTRGINRFLGLEMILTEIDSQYQKIPGLADYRNWCRSTALFSNEAVREQIHKGSNPIFLQVLDWSERVNLRVGEMTDEIGPFDGVKEALDAIKGHADVAVISSANPRAVQEEWTRFGFMEYVNYVRAQDAGTKADCIGQLAELGYERSHILMMGDSSGDEQAAGINGVHYYPILAGREVQSWQRFTKEALPRLLTGQFDDSYQKALIREFFVNLS